MQAPLYDAGFYANRHANTVGAARIMLSEVFRLCPGIETVLDVGCGVGTWLSVAQELGAREVFGLEGAWLKTANAKLAIAPEAIRSCELTSAWELGRTYDLAISLEVAEHLPPSAAENFVAQLAAAAPRVLFSAAIPNQGGIGHLNERWPSYWAGLFAAQGMAPYDVIRPAVWTQEKVSHFYRQNTLLYLRPAIAASFPLLAGRPPEALLGLLDRVHPLQLQGKQGEVNEAKALLDSPVQCLKHHIRPWLRRLRGR